MEIINESRIEEFTKDGKNFMYLDFSNIKTHDKLIKMMELAKSKIAKYDEQSLYTITNIENLRLDLKAKEHSIEYLNTNKRYVKSGALIGMDGIKKVMIKTVIKLSGRENIFFAYSKDQAVEDFLQQE